MFSYLTRFCRTALVAVLALTTLTAPVLAQNDSIGFCLPISNNVPNLFNNSLIRMDTYYDSVQWNALEKASYDPVPYQGNYEICDSVGFSVGSWYYVQAQAYSIAENGSHIVWNDTHVHVYFNPARPRVTVEWNESIPEIREWCSNSGC
jgi:hypothetical protein